MAIVARNASNLPAYNIRYSAFLGMLYVSTKEAEDAIKAAKAEIGGESEVKKGYTGNTGASAKALEIVKKKNVTPVKVTGRLTSVSMKSREVEGRQHLYLNVGLRDNEGRYYLSIDGSQEGAQALIRKLINASPDVETELAIFGTFDKREGAERAYAQHGASLKQDGKEVAGLSYKEAVLPLVTSELKKLEDAGVNKDSDKETFNKRRDKVEIDYHGSLVEKIVAHFAAYYEARGQNPQQDEGHEEPELENQPA